MRNTKSCTCNNIHLKQFVTLSLCGLACKIAHILAVPDKQGNTIDFLLTAKRDKPAALRFLKKAIGRNGKPSLINIDQSGANTAAIKQYNKDQYKRIKIRQCKYLNNIVEQDHRRIKRLTKPMMGFKNFYAAQKTLAGIEVQACRYLVIATVLKIK